jgi:ATP-binding cassette subfamily B (MDR/TAP) protein 1
LFFAKLLAAFAYPKSEYGMLRSTVNAWAGYYVALAAIAFITYGCQGLCFAYSTERLLHRAKDRCLRSILRQDISFFDEEEHSSGKLTSLLNSSTEDLTALSGVLIGSILTFISTIVTGLVVSIAIGWKLALVCTATIPLVVACGWVRLQVLVVFDEQIRQSGKDSAAYASEAVSAMKTVASLGLENHVLVAYDKILDKQAGNFMRSILSASALYAASQSAALLASALAFWYGGGLIANREYTVFQFYICFVTLVIGSQIAGAVFSYAPDASKAMYATQELKKIFNRVPRIKNNSSDGLRVGKAASGGKIEIHHVNFTYPSRLDRPILHDFNLTVEPGQYIAFVGPSGSGKSTILGLLERFYDPSSGQIKIDGQDISHLNIDDFRNLVSLVSQETTLYSGTIRENIVMGLGDNISDEDIVRVCKLANIHSFIESLS